MNTYIFDNNQDKTNEKIQMIFMGENTIYTEEIGNMYNLYDYFKDNNFNSDKILFCNFTGNQLEKLIIYISKYKCIDTFLKEYNKTKGYSMIISNKKKIRGLNYAKMDR